MTGNFEFKDFCLQFTHYSRLYILRVSELCTSTGGCTYLVKLNEAKGVFIVEGDAWSLISNEPLLHRLKSRIIKELQASKVLEHMTRTLYPKQQRISQTDIA